MNANDCLVDVFELMAAHLALFTPGAEVAVPHLVDGAFRLLPPVTRNEASMAIYWAAPVVPSPARIRWSTPRKTVLAGHGATRGEGHVQELEDVQRMESRKSKFAPCSLCVTEMWDATGDGPAELLLFRCVHRRVAALGHIRCRRLIGLLSVPCPSANAFARLSDGISRTLGYDGIAKGRIDGY